MKGISKKRVFVTGATQGIGKAERFLGCKKPLPTFSMAHQNFGGPLLFPEVRVCANSVRMRWRLCCSLRELVPESPERIEVRRRNPRLFAVVFQEGFAGLPSIPIGLKAVCDMPTFVSVEIESYGHTLPCSNGGLNRPAHECFPLLPTFCVVSRF
jgi:hypothetical protein